MINQKAQTLTELATFGSILLLVLSFFVSYGMRYNYQQDTQMRAFRMSMADAYNNGRPDASSSLVLVEDKHIPDPRDTFGVGNINPVQSGMQVVTWGNTLQDKYYKDGTTELDDTRLPTMKYMINSKAVNSKPVEYTTKGFYSITPPKQFYVHLTRPTTTTPPTTLVLIDDWAKVRVYQTKELDKDGKLIDGPKKAMILIENGPGDEDNEIEVIDEVAIAQPVGVNQYTPGPMMQVIGVKPDTDTTEQGDQITQLDLLSPSLGKINPNYLNLGGDTGNVDDKGNPIYVTPATLQGLWPEDMEITRKDKLTITQTPGVSNTVTFKNEPDFNAEITHKIISNPPSASKPAPGKVIIHSVSYNTTKGPAAWEIKVKE